MVYTHSHADHFGGVRGVTTQADYSYGVLSGFAGWKLSTVSDVEVSAYAGRYQTENARIRI